MPLPDQDLLGLLESVPGLFGLYGFLFGINLNCNFNLSLSQGRTGLDAGTSPFTKICPLNLHMPTSYLVFWKSPFCLCCIPAGQLLILFHFKIKRSLRRSLLRRPWRPRHSAVRVFRIRYAVPHRTRCTASSRLAFLLVYILILKWNYTNKKPLLSKYLKGVYWHWRRRRDSNPRWSLIPTLA